MLATAIAISEATKEAVFHEEIKALAGDLMDRRNEIDDRTFAKLIYLYSASLASKTADLTTKILLSETEMKEMLDSINELDDLTETILEENE
jgi:hypothetical protein